MFRSRRKSFDSGFTLVEILVVMVIMGLVITSVYSLFINTQRTANTSEEVVDVQQNLRVALDTIAMDIRMAGFLVPGGTAAIESATNALGMGDDFEDIGDEDLLVLNTVSSAKTYARVIDTIDQTINIPLGMLGNFRDGDVVDIVSHTNGSDVRAFGVSITVSGNAYEATGDISRVGPRDIIVRKLATEDGTDIRYWLRSGEGGPNNLQLMRRDSTENSSVVASNITGVEFVYFDTNGVPVDPADDLAIVNSVRITITGETDETRTGSDRYSGVKTRVLSTTVALRN